MPARRSGSPALLVAVGALVVLAAIALFQVVLEPPPSTPCSSSLAPGLFRAALAPVHLAAAAVLGGCLWSLGANRAGLVAAAAFALMSAVVPGVFGLVGWIAVFAGPPIGVLAVAALLIRTALVARSVHEPAERRAAHVTSARVALWLALVVALPANLSYAWLSGVSPFCF